jgi:ABC-2 type transport system permease protein
VKKIYLPREIFPLASIGGAAFMFAVQLVVLFVAALIFQSLPAPALMLWFFPSLLLILVYGIALGLLLSAMNVYLRDIQYLTEVVLMLAMWASPIVYSWGMVVDVFYRFGLPAWLLEVYAANPLTLAVLGFHKAFWGAGTAVDYPPDLGLRMAIAGAVGLVILWISHRVFTRLQGNFAQEL